MKFVLTGDWHLRAQRPQNRKDADYFDTQRGKVEQVLKLADENKACILQPGDFFDSVEVPWWVVKEYIDLFKGYGVSVYCVRGQHDLRFHSRKTGNTPLAVMEAAGVVEVVVFKEFGKSFAANPLLFGLSWGQETLDYAGALEEKTIKILLLHRMVVEEKLWPGQEDFIYAGHLFREYPDVDLFVCGDNHKSFVVEDKGRHVVNCGSLVRSSIDQADHRPVAYVYDTGDRSLAPHYLKVKRASEVLDLKRAKEEDKRDRDLQAFVEGLGEERDLGLDFLDNLRAVMSGEGVDSGVRGIIEEALGRVEK